MFRPRNALLATLIGGMVISGGPVGAVERDRLDDLLLMVRLLEAPRGYDDYYRGVSAPPPASLTSMSVAEVLDWQDRVDPSSPSEAAGGYMIMEDTLRDLHVAAGIGSAERFDQSTQDRLGEHLARDAGWASFERGEISARQFGDQLASVWAAFPLLTGQSRGRSRYHGIAGNKALISADKFEGILRNLGSVDVAALIGVGGKKAVARPAVAPTVEPTKGFEPSRVVRWTSDPFFQE